MITFFILNFALKKLSAFSDQHLVKWRRHPCGFWNFRIRSESKQQTQIAISDLIMITLKPPVRLFRLPRKKRERFFIEKTANNHKALRKSTKTYFFFISAHFWWVICLIWANCVTLLPTKPLQGCVNLLAIATNNSTQIIFMSNPDIAYACVFCLARSLARFACVLKSRFAKENNGQPKWPDV